MHRVSVLAVLLVVALMTPTARGAPASAGPHATPGPAGTEDRLYAGVRPAERAAIIAATAGRLPVYTIDATLSLARIGGIDGAIDAAPATVAGTLDLRYVNGTGTALSELYLRLYANDARYDQGDADGGTVLRDVAVDGSPVSPELSVDDTVARLPLPTPVPPSGGAHVTLAFTTTVPSSDDFFSSQFNAEPATGTVALSHWYPMLAGYDPAFGWVLDPVSRFGDLVFADIALYDVTLSAPDNLVLIVSGVEQDETDLGDEIRREYVTGPAREFGLIVDDNFAAVSRVIDGTTVTSYFNPEHESGGQAALDYGEQALALFGDLFGPYPYAELDLVEWPMHGAGGFELPQMVWLDTSLYDDLRAQPGGPLELVVAHEVAHQWWYGLVGNNHYAHAFLDEGLASYSEVLYIEREYGPETADWWLSRLPAPDEVVDQPTVAFGHRAYSETVYGKAALGMAALRAEIGDAAFFGALRDYAARMRFAVATPIDLRAAFERASGRDVSEAWHAWFESAVAPSQTSRGSAAAPPPPAIAA